jgi:pseudomonalisin
VVRRSVVRRSVLGPVFGTVTAGALCLSGVAAASGVLPNPVASGASGTSGVVQLIGNRLPSLSQLASQPADPGASMTVGVALRRPHTDQEQAILTAQQDPASPSYHRFLSLAQVVSRFGVPASRTRDVTARLRAAGLRIDAVDATGDYVSASGTVAQVQRAFGVTERRYTARGVSFLANTAGPFVPAQDAISTVVGLNTLQHFTRALDSARGQRPAPAPAAALSRSLHPTRPGQPARPAQSGCRQSVCMGNTTPQDLWSVYDQPKAFEGQGVKLAIIGEGNPKNLLGYLRKQEKAYGLPKVPFTVHCVQHGDCGSDVSGDGEWQIDTQASGGMAPRSAGEELYFAKAIFDPDLNNSFVAWAQDPRGPKLASASLGECESSPANGVFTGPLAATNANLSGGPQAVQAFGNGEAMALDPVLKTAVMMGKTLFASSGDTGSSCPVVVLPVIGGGNGVLNQGVPEQNYPAVSPNVVAVGGTVLYTNNNGEGSGATYKPSPPASRTLEYAWTFGGGGASLYQPAPSWQRNTPGINRPCVVSASGGTAATGSLCRGVPDVAAQSGDVASNGYSVVGAGGFTSGGGTSLSSPLWLGMWARVQGAAGHNLGFAAPLLYKVGNDPTSYARDFTDITVGSNGLYPTTPGWDYTTGFGVPKVSGLIRDLAAVTPAQITHPTTHKSGTPAPATPPAATQPNRSLASTGLPIGLAIAASALLGTALLLRRLQRH